MRNTLRLVSVIFSFFAVINVYAGDYEPIGIEGKRERKELTYESLKTTLDKYLEENPQLFDSSKGKDIVAVLGKTGAGKSTLINYLSGKKLKTEEKGLRGKIIINDPEDKSAMVIGIGKDSQTHLPQFVDIGDLRFYDLPGLDDTGGGPYELLNASFIKHIIENARTTRLVIVTGLDEVTAGRGKPFKDLSDRVASLLPAPLKISMCSSLVVTKTPGVADLERSLLEEVDRQYLSPWLGAAKSRISQMSRPNSASIGLGESKLIMESISSVEPIAIGKINTRSLYSYEVSGILQGMLKKEMLLYLDKLVKTVDKQILETKDKVALERIELIKPALFQRQLESDIASSKFITLLKPFLDEVDYVQVLSSLEVVPHTVSLQAKVNLEIEKIKAEEERIRAEAEARARVEAEIQAKAAAVAAAKAEQERLAAVAKAEARAAAAAKAEQERLAAVAKAAEAAAAAAEKERKENDPRNWPVSVERRDEVISTYWGAPYHVPGIREPYDRGMWKSDGHRWPLFQKQIRVTAVKERRVARKKDGSQFVILQDWYEVSRTETETGATQRTGGYIY